MVRSSHQNVDLLIAPGSEYVARPSDESLFTGYYCESPTDENFYMSILDGYPKFERGIIKDDINFPDDPTASRQVAANLGFITANRANRGYLEYRFNFEDMTLQGYENKDYQSIAQVKFSNWLKPENMGGPFQIDPAHADELQTLLDAFVGDKTEEEYNALAASFLACIVKPEMAFTAIKNVGGQYIGDRNQTYKTGMYADFGTPNGANSRAYMKKVDDTHYQVGFNGLYLQAPVAGEQVTKGETPATFEIIITEPGKFALMANEVALTKNGMLTGTTVAKDEETGEYKFGNNTLWTIDTNYSDVVRADAKIQFDGMQYGTVCLPYAVKADNSADPDAVLYTVMYNDNDDLVLTETDRLEAGQPGVVMGTNSPVQLTIEGGFVSKPVVPTGDYALKGILSVLPEEGAYQNPHTLGLITTTEIVGEDDEAQYVTTTKLGLVMGNYDINNAFWEGGANTDDVALVMPDVKWDRVAARQLGAYLSDGKVGGAFQIPTERVDEFKQKITLVASETDFNALKSEMTASVTRPETFYGALKNSQFMGERNQNDGTKGLYTNFNTPNGVNSRIYMKKTDNTHYSLGFNGRYIQSPENGVMAVADVTPTDFDITVTEPGKITISKDGVYLVAATTLQGGQLGEQAYWTIDNSYTGFIRQDAKQAAGDLTFGAITVPYTVKADKDADEYASLYTVTFNGNTLDMHAVDELPAGMPGIVAGSKTPVQLTIVGGYVSEPAAPGDNNALNGILGVNPGDYDFENPLFLGVNGAGELVMDYNAWYDINQSFFNAQAGVSEVKFTKVPSQTDGITEITTGTKKTGTVYNLSGQKVTDSFRGIIIVDGKKVIRK